MLLILASVLLLLWRSLFAIQW